MHAFLVGVALLSLPFPRVATKVPATLGIRVDLHGQADVTLGLVASPPEEGMALEALNEALGVELEEVRIQSGERYLVLQGRAPDPFISGGWAKTCELRIHPLLKLAGLVGAESLHISLTHPQGGFVRGPSWKGTTFVHTQTHRFTVHQSATYPLDGDPPPFRVEFGYHPWDAWQLVLLSAILALPLFLTARRRRRAIQEIDTNLASGAGDPLRAWFHYKHFQRRLLIAFWAVWLVLLAVLDVPRMLWFTLGTLTGEMTDMPLFEAVLFAMLPPLLVTATCLYLSRSAYARPPEVRWAAGMILRRTVGPTVLLSGVCVAWALASEWRDVRAGWVADLSLPYFALFPAVYVGIAGLWGSIAVRDAALLPEGPLRNRVVELSEDFGVPFFQVAALPAASWRAVNVLYPFRTWLFLTPDLLARLSRREIDALLAHQLAESHLVRTRGWWLTPLGFALGIGVFVALLASGRFFRLDFARWWPLLLPLPMALTYLARTRLRRLAPRGDVAGAALIGDPEAMLTALHKLQQLRLVPLTAQEPAPPAPGVASPGPAPPRLKALATRARIPPERLETLLTRAGTAGDSYPPLLGLAGLKPDWAGGTDERVFSSGRKNRIVLLLLLAYFGFQIGLPALAAYLAQTGVVSGVWAVLLFLGSVAGAFFLFRGLLWVLSARILRRVRNALRTRLKGEGTLPDASPALWVALSPGPAPHIHEGFFFWDLGFLVLTGDHFCYLGDRTRFALPRTLVRSVTLGPGPPDWRRHRMVYLHWEDVEKKEGDTLLLSFAGPHPEEELARRLEGWLQEGRGEAVPHAEARPVRGRRRKGDACLPPAVPIPNTGLRPQVTPAHLGWLGFVLVCAVVGTIAGSQAVQEPWPWMTAIGFGLTAYVVLDLIHNAPVWFRHRTLEPEGGERPAP